MAKETIEVYDRTYYEDGLATGKSLYNGFVWMPERSMCEAVAIIDTFKLKRGERVFDFGCAKGFLVKALRLLGREAFGCDVSRYAVCTADPDVRPYLMLCTPEVPFPFMGKLFSLGIAKDVLEHLDEDELDAVLDRFKKSFQYVFVAVPLGDGKHFTVPEYNYDATHKIAQTEEWWRRKFEQHKFAVDFSLDLIPGMKTNWNHYELGNRFFGLISWV